MKAVPLFYMLIWWAAAQAQMLPPDGSTVTVLELDAVMDESCDVICDLSDAAVIAETEMKFEYYGDTLVRRIAGQRADWLRVCNDTIWSLGTDTRRANTRFSRGLPYLLPLPDAAVSDSMRHCMFMSYDRDDLVSFRYGSGKGPSFILQASDTIASTYCIETELCDTIGKVRHRRWYAEGAVWPVVEYVTTTIGEDEFNFLNICPPCDQPQPAMYARGNNASPRTDIFSLLASMHGSDPSPSPSPVPYGVITMTDGAISVSGRIDGNATVWLYDTAGRLWHEGTARTAISTAHLPAGVYLLHITSETESYATKISIAGS